MKTFNSEIDYDHLPEAVQRKYFSSLERLRLAHDGTSSKLAPRPSTAWKTSKPSFQRSHSITSHLDVARPSRRFSQSTRRRLQKPEPTGYRRPSTAVTSPGEYASLPPALQKKLFSQEEQVVLGSRIQEIILDAADEALCRRFRQQSTSDHSAHSIGLSEQSRTYDFSDTESEYSAEEMNSSDLDSFRWLDDEDELDLKLDDYHAIIAENAARLKAAPWTQSNRRGLSLSTVSFRRRSSSSASMRSPVPVPNIDTQISTLPKPGPILRHHHNKLSTSSLDPAATHYQDPTARLKLRVYLASPQKFDEALEFGFPALQDQNPVAVRPRTSPVEPGSTARTFFNDDTPSLSADEEGDDRDEQRRRQGSPSTPVTPIFPPPRPSFKASIDKPALRPQFVPRFTELYSPTSSTDREMTLHMTLTRPDLRSPDDTHQPRPNINDAPLEHAPLTVPNHVGTIWDELPEEPSKVKRFLKKITFRG